MSESFVKLFSSITDSSIWYEDNATRIVWVTILAMCDEKGCVHASIKGIAGRSRVTEAEAKVAIDKFLSPDPDSRSKEFEGRRLAEIDRGWLILNYSTFRAKRDKAERDAYMADYMRKYRKQHSKQSLTDVNIGKPQLAQGEGEGEGYKKSSLFSPDFECVWKMYPDKTGKQKAYDAYRRWKAAGDTSEMMIDGIKRYLASVDHKRRTGFSELKYKNGSSFFHQRCWTDEGLSAPATVPNPTVYIKPAR